MVHQDTDPELEEVPDLEVKLGEDLSEDQQCILKDLTSGGTCIYRYAHRVKLKDNTPICCKPYSIALC